MRSFTTEDASRANRPVGITIWYPALPSEGTLAAVHITMPYLTPAERLTR